MAREPTASDASGSFTDAMVIDVFEPEIDALRRDPRALHRGGGNADDQVTDAELIESAQELALSGLECGVDHGLASGGRAGSASREAHPVVRRQVEGTRSTRC